MITDVRDWLNEVLQNEYKFFFGMWKETNSDYESKYCVIIANSGAAPITDVRFPNFKVLLIGARDSNDTAEICNDAYRLIDESMTDSKPCGFSAIKSTGEPIGPAFTTEGRAWMQLNFSTIF